VQHNEAKFTVGQLVLHKLFGYRGVIIDVDPFFQGSEQWYQQVARTRPPKDRPWYHVLVHDAEHQTYVAERNLMEDSSGEAIEHDDIDFYFIELKNGMYYSHKAFN